MKTKQQRINELQKELIGLYRNWADVKSQVDSRTIQRLEDDIESLEAEPDSEQVWDEHLTVKGNIDNFPKLEYTPIKKDSQFTPQPRPTRGQILGILETYETIFPYNINGVSASDFKAISDSIFSLYPEQPSDEDINAAAFIYDRRDRSNESEGANNDDYIGFKAGAKAALNGQIPVSK